MAQDFERAIARNVGTSASTILTSDSDDAVIGIRLSNILTSAINVSVYVTTSTLDYYLVKDVSIPPASAVEIIQGGSKVVLQSGDALKVVSDTASSTDVWVSYIDTISA
jgi:hypothetical protein